MQLLFRSSWWSWTACCLSGPWWKPPLRSQRCLCCLCCRHTCPTMYGQAGHPKVANQGNGNVRTNFPFLLNSQFILVSEGILEEIARLLHHNRSSCVIVTHCCEIMASLCSSSIGQQVHGSSNARFNTCCSCLRVCVCARYPRHCKIKLNRCCLGCAGESVSTRTPGGPPVSRPVRRDLTARDVVPASVNDLRLKFYSSAFRCWGNTPWSA